jgi:hypothetical protein
MNKTISLPVLPPIGIPSQAVVREPDIVATQENSSPENSQTREAWAVNPNTNNTQSINLPVNIIYPKTFYWQEFKKNILKQIISIVGGVLYHTLSSDEVGTLIHENGHLLAIKALKSPPQFQEVGSATRLFLKSVCTIHKTACNQLGVETFLNKRNAKGTVTHDIAHIVYTHLNQSIAVSYDALRYGPILDWDIPTVKFRNFNGTIVGCVSDSFKFWINK